MSEQSRIIPSEEDFNEISVQIIKLIGKSNHPPSSAELCEFTNRSAYIIEIYTQRLLDAGIINYIPTRVGKWGFIHKKSL